MSIQIFALLIMLLPWCSSITPEVKIIGGPARLDAALDDKFLTFNGEIVTLREIYGDKLPTAETFKPGVKLARSIFNYDEFLTDKPSDVSKNCPGGVYVEREFVFQPSTTVSSLPISSEIKDTPTAIARKLAQDIKTHTPPITLVTGESRMGKSVALSKIQNELHKEMPTTWSIQVDLARIVPSKNSIERMDLNYIIKAHIEENARDLFHNLLEVNPKKIVFMFDGVDEMGRERSTKLASIIKTLSQNGATIVLTGRTFTAKFLEDEQLPITVYEIPEMNVFEATKFLRNILKADLESQPGPSTSTTSPSTIDDRLNDYVSAFTHALYKTPIPRQPETLQTMTNYIKGSLFWNFVLDEMPVTPMLLASIEGNTEIIPWNVYNLYEDFRVALTRLRYDCDDPAFYYGSIGMAQIVQSDVTPNTIDQFLGQMDRAASRAADHMKKFKESFVFAHCNDDGLVRFISPEYRRFFAVDYIRNSLNDIEEDTTEFWLQLVSNPRYRGVMELLDCNTDSFTNMETKLIVFPSTYHLFQVLDNVIGNGYETFYLQIQTVLKTMNRLNELQKYFFVQRSVQYGPKRTLGIMQSDQPHPDFNRIEPLPKFGTQLELLIENDMLKACRQILSDGIRFRRNENYQQLLRIAATKRLPNPQLVSFLMDEIIQHHDLKDSINLHEILYDVVSDVGDGCQDIVNYLVQCGAKATKATRNGRTLLHAAVQWNSANLLQYVVEELHVPPIDTADELGRTVFWTALETNPSPLQRVPGWWEMMSYLVQRVKHLSLPSSAVINGLEGFTIPKEDVESPWFKFMLSSTNDFNDVSFQRHSVLMRFIPPRLWNLSPGTLAIRPTFLLQELYTQSSNIFPIEVLIRYRGVGSMSPAQSEQYQTTVKLLYQRGKDSLTVEAKGRILRALVENACHGLGDFTYVSNHDLYHELETQTGLKSSSLLADSLYNVISRGPPATEFISLCERLTQPRIDHNQYLAMDVDSESSTSTIIDDAMEICETRRRRRRSFFLVDCKFLRKIVNRLNDAPEHPKISGMSISSDKVVQVLAVTEYNNPTKAKQQVEILRYLHNKADASKIITGNSQMLLRDVLRYGSLTAYRQNQRITHTINDLWQPLPSTKSTVGFRMPSRTVALYAAASIPLIRGLYGTITMCLQQHNDTNHNCLYASSALAVSTTLAPAGFMVAKFMPWMIDRFSRTTLEFLPSAAAPVLRENVKLLRYFGFKFGAQAIAVGLGIVGLGFDLYNIVEMSKLIAMCSQEVNGCPSKDKIDYLISLSFSCVSITVAGGLMITGVGFVAGLMIGLALLMLEIFALGINDVIYYSNKYDTNFDENARIFFHRIAFQPPPSDVQALARRTDWMNNLQQRVEQLLEASDENIVAYGVGLGVLTDSSVIAGVSSINMSDANPSNTRGLSRVLPITNNRTTLLCLPKHDETAVYDKYSNDRAGAVYRCHNAFVIAHKERWGQRNSENSSIVYDLEYVENGTIVGINTLNNLFLIYNGIPTFTVIGGSGDTTNTYLMRSESFRGRIHVNRQSRKNVFDLSAIKSSILDFKWSPDLHEARVQFGNNNSSAHFWLTSDKSSPNLHVIGRVGKPEMLTCNYNTDHYLADDDLSITIDSGGGHSLSEMDHVIECKISVIRPFTRIVGSNNANATYTTYVSLDYAISTINSAVHAIIQPQRSKFIITFANRPLLASTYNVTYIPSSRTLSWALRYTASSSLVLSIESYRSPQPPLQENTTINESNMETVNCVFVDSYSGTIVYPVIDLPTDTNKSVAVRHFNVFASVNSSRLIDMISHYQNLLSYYGEREPFIITKFIYPKTGQTFTFGSSTSDRFYIDRNTTFLFGGSGNDVYSLNRESSNYVWIENEADDDALDTFIIPDAICESLSANRGSLEFDCCDSSRFDVTLLCSVGNTTTSPNINVILRDYLLESRYRHLQIYWRDSTYVLLPYHWTQQYQNSSDVLANNTVELALFFSFGKEWRSTTLTLTSRDTYVAFNIDSTNPLIAYKSGSNDIIVARKYLDHDSSSFVIFKDFLSNHTSSNISTDWLQTRIFIINPNITKEAIPKVLGANDIWNLFINTLFDDIRTQTHANAHFIKEYFVNITDAAIRNETITIEHNNNSVTEGGHRLGVLTVVGATPEEFHAQWDLDGTSLQLCTRQTCICIKNYCRSILHRLYRMELALSLLRQPVIIRHLDRLECQRQSNNSHDNQLIKQFDQKFVDAQKQLLLTDKNDDNDNSRLMMCVGSIFADIAAHNSMYKLFGFYSVIEQVNFMRENCNALFTRTNREQLSLAAMNITLENTIKKYELVEPAQELHESIALIRQRIRQLTNICWQNFTTSLYNHSSNTTDLKMGNATLQILDKSARVLERCFQEA